MANNENIIVGGKAKVDRRKTSLYESGVRKRLADISNFPKNSKLAIGVDKSPFLPNSDKVYLDKLQKENTSLLKLLEEKNKIIELSGSELQKLTVNMQKTQQQNFQLAQANSLMLTELNAGKDRLKAMQHQLGCTNSLLRVKEMEQKEKSNIRICQQCENQSKVETTNCEKDLLEIVEADRNQSNIRSTNWKRQQKSQSLGHSTVKHVESKEKTEDESVCLRTQPVSFKPEEAEPKKEDMVLLKEKAENKRLLEPTKEDTFPLKENAENKRVRPRRNSAIFKHEEPKKEDTCLSKEKTGNERVHPRINSAIFEHEEPKLKEEDMLEITDSSKLSVSSSSLDGNEGSIGQSLNSNELRRTSIARPSRFAAKKVQCYKEVPLNVKMRRPE